MINLIFHSLCAIISLLAAALYVYAGELLLSVVWGLAWCIWIGTVYWDIRLVQLNKISRDLALAS